MFSLSKPLYHVMIFSFQVVMLNTRIFKMYEQPFYVRLLRNMVPNCHQVRQNRTHAMNSGQIKLLMEVFGKL
jgi:hypothetical protein